MVQHYKQDNVTRSFQIRDEPDKTFPILVQSINDQFPGLLRDSIDGIVGLGLPALGSDTREVFCITLYIAFLCGMMTFHENWREKEDNKNKLNELEEKLKTIYKDAHKWERYADIFKRIRDSEKYVVLLLPDKLGQGNILRTKRFSEAQGVVLGVAEMNGVNLLLFQQFPPRLREKSISEQKELLLDYDVTYEILHEHRFEKRLVYRLKGNLHEYDAPELDSSSSNAVLPVAAAIPAIAGLELIA